MDVGIVIYHIVYLQVLFESSFYMTKLSNMAAVQNFQVTSGHTVNHCVKF
jgi:hypothetical protein